MTIFIFVHYSSCGELLYVISIGKRVTVLVYGSEYRRYSALIRKFLTKIQYR